MGDVWKTLHCFVFKKRQKEREQLAQALWNILTGTYECQFSSLGSLCLGCWAIHGTAETTISRS